VKITVKADAQSGTVHIPAGEYLVALASDTQQIRLTGRGIDIKLPAVRRRSNGKTRVTTITFYSGGGSTWSLVVSTPRQGEWLSMVDYVDTKSSKSEKK
jgi:hypothetical protein